MTRISPVELDNLFKTLQTNFDALAPEQAVEIRAMVQRFGYLPWSCHRTNNELPPAETLCGPEEKLCLNKVFIIGNFITDAAWQIGINRKNLKLSSRSRK